jgi:hypothetical protein
MGAKAEQASNGARLRVYAAIWVLRGGRETGTVSRNLTKTPSLTQQTVNIHALLSRDSFFSVNVSKNLGARARREEG